MIPLWQIVVAGIPSLLLALLMVRIDKNREPLAMVAITFVSGIVAFFLVNTLVTRVASYAGLSSIVGDRGEAGSFLFLFAFVAPIQEASKVFACGFAFRTRHFDEPFDGMVYASLAALGFSFAETLWMLRHYREAEWLIRTALAMPAHWFFACGWGYVIGRAGTPTGAKAFAVTWFGMTVSHAMYIHVVYGRGLGGLVAVVPLLLAMFVVIFLAARDLRIRGDRLSILPHSVEERLSHLPLSIAPPSIQSMREALRRSDEPLALRWVFWGALAHLGGIILGFFVAVFSGRMADINFAVLDERSSSSFAALLLLGAGVLAAFPVCGFFVARAASLPTILESAMASALSILAVIAFLAVGAPGAMVFVLACAPVAWGFACMGAWIGRTRGR